MTASEHQNGDQALLELKQVSVEFANQRLLGRKREIVRAVDEVSLTVRRGEIVALIGGSGSGKTTTVRAALGLQPVNAGAVLFSGQPVGAMTAPALFDLRRRVQLIFQDPTEALNPRMTVEQILLEGLAIHRVGTANERQTLIAEALGFVGLEPTRTFLPRHPHTLSGGQRQRVAIAASLALSPNLLIADEPVSMLDPSIRAGILDLFARLRAERGMSTLMVTHDLPSAYHLADRVYVMNRGRIIEEGETRRIRSAAPRLHDDIDPCRERCAGQRTADGMMLNRPALRLSAAQHQFVFDAAAQPALIIDAGQTVVIETLDCFCGRLTADSPPLRDDKDVLAHIGGRYNPVNQPIFVRGAEPGDTLEIEILDIELGQRQGFAVTHVAHDWARRFGGNTFADAVAPATIFAYIDGQRIRLPVAGRMVEFEARPMIGTIGTAPKGEAVSSLLYGSGHGGNLDCPGIRPGATVLLPVNVPGGLLSLGDIHALMGDGEITGTAMESSADVTIRVGLRQGRRVLTTPRLDDPASKGSIGCASRGSLQDNIQFAVLDLAASLQDDTGLSSGDALQLINLFGKIVINQAVSAGSNGWASVLVWIEKVNLDHR